MHQGHSGFSIWSKDASIGRLEWPRNPFTTFRLVNGLLDFRPNGNDAPTAQFTYNILYIVMHVHKYSIFY